jgi:TPR repeat protein
VLNPPTSESKKNSAKSVEWFILPAIGIFMLMQALFWQAVASLAGIAFFGYLGYVYFQSRKEAQDWFKVVPISVALFLGSIGSFYIASYLQGLTTSQPTKQTSDRAVQQQISNLASPQAHPVNSETERLEAKAKSGDSRAQFELGQLCEKAKPERLEEAVKWYQLAAQKGYAPAEDGLGSRYIMGGGGLSRNPQLALAWFRKAAEQGYAQAEFNIGETYYGEVDPPNYKEAIKWYQKACNQNLASAYVALGALYDDGAAPRNPKMAVALLRKGAELGDMDGQFRLAEHYLKGTGVRKDRSEAASWYRKSAAQNYSPAEAMLGRMYDHGWGMQQDKNQAIIWYQRAAGHGDSLAQGRLEALKGGSDKDPFETVDKFFSADAREKEEKDTAQYIQTINKRLSQFADSYEIAQLTGQEVELAIPPGNLKTMWGGRTYVSDVDFLTAVVNKDKAGMQALLDSDQIIMLTPKTKALLVQFDKGAETGLVHIASGSHIGEDLLVMYNFIKPIN